MTTDNPKGKQKRQSKRLAERMLGQALIHNPSGQFLYYVAPHKWKLVVSAKAKSAQADAGIAQPLS